MRQERVGKSELVLSILSFFSSPYSSTRNSLSAALPVRSLHLPHADRKREARRIPPVAIRNTYEEFIRAGGRSRIGAMLISVRVSGLSPLLEFCRVQCDMRLPSFSFSSPTCPSTSVFPYFSSELQLRMKLLSTLLFPHFPGRSMEI